jgi:Raf kinase inhibitor-like YbhB/YbcL family protein
MAGARVFGIPSRLGILLVLACQRQPEARPDAGSPPSPTRHITTDASRADSSLEPGDSSMATWTLHSTAFDAGRAIPKRHTGDGQDLSPPLGWSDPPSATRGLALVLDDPDAPTPEPWVHWLLYNIPPSVKSLPEGVPTTRTLTQPPGAAQGLNSWQKPGYRGPAPPPGHGTHHYHFKLYALDTALGLNAGLDKRAVLDAIKGHILAETELIGTYAR